MFFIAQLERTANYFLISLLVPEFQWFKKRLQTERTCSCTTADAKHLVVKVTNSVPGHFHEAILCPIFVSVNAFLKVFIVWTYSSHPWIWPAYVKSRAVSIRTVEIMGLCLQWDRVSSPKINHSTSAVANRRPTSSLNSFTWFRWGII